MKKSGLAVCLQQVNTCKKYGVFAGILVFLCMMPAKAEKGFYTIVDAQGRLVTLPLPDDDVDSKKTIKKTIKSTAKRAAPLTTDAKATKPAVVKKQVVSNQQPINTKSTDKKPLTIEDKRHKLQVADDADKVNTNALGKTAISKADVNKAVVSKTLVNEARINKSTKNNTTTNKTIVHKAIEHKTIVNKTAVEKTTVTKVATAKKEYKKPAVLAANVNTKVKVDTSTKVNTAALPKKPNANGLVNYENVKYVDSIALQKAAEQEQQEKQFYPVPNPMGGVDFIKRDNSTVRAQDNLAINNLSSITEVAATYEIISNKTVKNMLSTTCVAKEKLLKLKQVKANKSVSLWPRADRKRRNDNKASDEIPANYIKINADVGYISMVSYASSSKNPSYYWPMAVFLDNKGCSISGVSGFYQKEYPATWLEQSAIQGSLLVPTNAKYVMLTPLLQTPELNNKKLTNKGALRLSGYSAKRL